MRKSIPTIALASALAIGAVGLAALYAQGTEGSPDSMMNRGTMGHGPMMGRMGRMMDHCTNMMQSRGNDSGRPNEQWRKPASSTPEKSG